jgi:hypothetical protein
MSRRGGVGRSSSNWTCSVAGSFLSDHSRIAIVRPDTREPLKISLWARYFNPHVLKGDLERIGNYILLELSVFGMVAIVDRYVLQLSV